MLFLKKGKFAGPLSCLKSTIGDNCIVKGDNVHYIKKVLKWIVLLAFPAYFFFTFKPKEIQSELSLYIKSDRDTTYNVYVITKTDSINRYEVQKRFVLSPDEEKRYSLEASGINDTLYLYTEQRGISSVFEYVVDTAVYNELLITDSAEYEFFGNQLKESVTRYKEHAMRDIFLVILYLWLIFIVIYIRSRK